MLGNVKEGRWLYKEGFGDTAEDLWRNKATNPQNSRQLSHPLQAKEAVEGSSASFNILRVQAAIF